MTTTAALVPVVGVGDPPDPAPPRRRRSSGGMRVGEQILRYALLLFVLLITIGPFLWQFSTSLRGPGEDIYTTTPSFLPAEPTLGNYAAVGATIPVWQYIGNSLVVAALTVSGNLVFATLAGYALARLRFRGRGVMLAVFVGALVLPAEVTIIAQFVTIREFGLADTLLGVALPAMASVLNVLLMYNAFRNIPPEIDQAAIVDGANTWQRLRLVALPSVYGTLAVVAIFSFIGAWDDFLWPLIVLNTPDRYTLTIGLQYLQGTFSTDQRLIAAGTMIAFIPIAVVFAALQRYFFRGVEEGGVKG